MAWRNGEYNSTSRTYHKLLHATTYWNNGHIYMEINASIIRKDFTSHKEAQKAADLYVKEIISQISKELEL